MIQEFSSNRINRFQVAWGEWNYPYIYPGEKGEIRGYLYDIFRIFSDNVTLRRYPYGERCRWNWTVSLQQVAEMQFCSAVFVIPIVYIGIATIIRLSISLIPSSESSLSSCNGVLLGVQEGSVLTSIDGSTPTAARIPLFRLSHTAFWTSVSTFYTTAWINNSTTA